ncbi:MULTISPECIES: adenylyl-sulfate kinase [unclassified Helicobacter]|uniref:adenylyl-sulfate kinase n=1 Tax=unclassified Helicobacter TaxID=2593540 RepID=UPI000CF088F6|nr:MULTISPECIES: adenylyl-sulfate kinase [unclassified Helicobacter]
MQKDLLQKRGAVVWICGLAGSGKSTIARALQQIFLQKKDNVIYLDGDELRDILGYFNYDKNSRIQMAKKRALMANFLANQGMIVLVSTISLFNEVYDFNRQLFSNYNEIFVDCELEELKRRDQKGLYSGSQNKKIQNVVGIDIQYDYPKADLIVVNNTPEDLDNNIQTIMQFLLQKNSSVFN